ncbi:MAG: hypothetical protein CXR31_09830 [Geobacter sp.]|nr:MAG: hypothetical protein CXR31_09830 [Geobacter sp.]
MKIQCPDCQLSGQISDANVPAEGMNMDCPRCKTSFYVKKEATANWKDTATECPVCQFSTFSEERFDICPTCGLVIKDYNEKKGKGGASPAKAASAKPSRQQEASDPAEVSRRTAEDLRRLEEKNATRSYGGLDPGESLLTEQTEIPRGPLIPLPLQLIGGAFILLALIVIVYSWSEIRSYYANLAEVGNDELLAANFAALHSVWDEVVLPVIRILLSAVTVVVAVCFLRRLPRSRVWMEMCVWGGLVCVILDQLVSLLNWILRSSTDATIGYYSIGAMSMLVMLVLWGAPFLAAVWFLRGDLVGDLFDEVA